MGIVEVVVVIAAGVALASVLCRLTYSVAIGEVDHGSDWRGTAADPTASGAPLTPV